MTSTAIIYANPRARVERRVIKGKVRYVAIGQNSDEPLQPPYKSKDEAIEYAQHLKNWASLWKQTE